MEHENIARAIKAQYSGYISKREAPRSGMVELDGVDIQLRDGSRWTFGAVMKVDTFHQTPTHHTLDVERVLWAEPIPQEVEGD